MSLASLQTAHDRLVSAKAELTAYAQTLEDLVTQRTAELAATNKQMEAFVYSIAHDLRAPLRAMQGYSAMLVEDVAIAAGSDAATYANRINKAAQHMDALLGDLLAFSRISQQSVVLSAVDVRGIAGTVVERLQPEIAASGARIEFAPDWPAALGHDATISQVMSNLISNALKFVRPHEPPVIALRAEARAQFIRVWIEDNGVGIPLDHQEQIFRLFTRLNGEKYPGTGIGLAIVQKGIERLGGRVGLESVTGRGSRFWFELLSPDAPGALALLR